MADSHHFESKKSLFTFVNFMKMQNEKYWNW